MIPFCDFVSVTTPLGCGSDLLTAIRPVMDMAGSDVVHDKSGEGVLFRCGSGTVRYQHRFSVAMVGASGGVLSALRSVGLLDEFLFAVSTVPHRVTRLDATLDFAEAAPPVIAALAARARGAGVSLSRKSVPATDVQTHLALDARGALTGSVYLGSAQAEVRGVVYDKRHERESKWMADPGPLLRYEIRVRSGFYPSLRDASAPSAMFYHFASPDLVPAPLGVPQWVPGGVGFALEKRMEFTPAELMARKLDASTDVQRLVELAHACGPGGPALLLRRLSQLLGVSAGAAGCLQGAEAVAAVLPSPIH